MTKIDARNRAATLDALEEDIFDCVIIGGGITGAGIAREGARAGLKIALLESQDFASGTSSRSSKLIHGGLRYLAQGDVALVRKTALERKVIHGLAKHLCEPRWMVFPTKSFVSQTTMRTAVTTYEKLGAVEGQDVHETWDRDQLLESEPTVNAQRYSSAVVFREYLTDDARLVMANLRAATGDGATVLNHVEVTKITGESQADGVRARCSQTDREITVRGSVVINAAGPWVDEVRQLEADADAKLMLSKGIHIVIKPERLPVKRMVTVTTADKRTLFVIAQHDGVYIGTTDTLTGNAATTWPEVTREDVSYILDAIEVGFDVPPIAPEDVIAAWAGLRPLVGEEGKTPGEISRKDEIWVGPRNVLAMAGGKLTGYRPMANDALERAASVGPFDFVANNDDHGPTLPGGDFDGEVWDLSIGLQKTHGLDERTADRVARLYGTEAAQIIDIDATPIADGSSVLRGEISWAINVEGALTLEDIVYRRTRIAWFSTNRIALVEPIAAIAATGLGWSDAETTAQITHVTQLMAAELAFQEK